MRIGKMIKASVTKKIGSLTEIEEKKID